MATRIRFCIRRRSSRRLCCGMAAEGCEATADGAPLPGESPTAARGGRGAARAAVGAGRGQLKCWDGYCVQGSQRGEVDIQYVGGRGTWMGRSCSFPRGALCLCAAHGGGSRGAAEKCGFRPCLLRPQPLLSERRKRSVCAPIGVLRESPTGFNVSVFAALS